jgi:CelD/BcsL family acetyltransferase involved in cellulose biosynthesis
VGTVIDVQWLHRADDIDDATWLLAAGHSRFSKAWMRLNEHDLLKSAEYIVLREGGQPLAFTPCFEIDRDTLLYYSPRLLLASYLREAEQPALAETVEGVVGPDALVCLVPGTNVSPLVATPPDLLGPVAAAALARARARGLAALAFLYLDDGDARALAILEGLGFSSAVIDAAPEIAIDPAWHGTADYLTSLRRRSTVRTERRRFLQAGFTVEWHDRISGPLAERITDLNHALHRRKGNHTLTREAIHHYFISIAPELHPLVVTAMRGGVIEAFALWCRDREHMWAIETGFQSSAEFQYFNLMFYEAVDYAIAQGVRRIDFGLGTSEAKRVRVNRVRRLYGAFQFFRDPLRPSWNAIAEALARRHARFADVGARP